MPTPSSPSLTDRGLNELVDLVRQRRVSIEEVTASYLARIAALDPALGAFVHLDADAVLAEARRADTVSATRGAIGPLHGVPIGLKDIFDVAGMPTSGGSALPATHPTADSAVAHSLRSAGAILVGKLASSEFSCGSPYLRSRPQNPWHRDHAAGGSSTGAGIAVSAGLLPAAVGGDTGGSVRIPASFCGTVGFRPSTGLVSPDGAIPLAPGIDTAGPLARSAADAELVLRVIRREDQHVGPQPVRAVTVVDTQGEGVAPQVAAAVQRVATEAAALLDVDLRVVRAEPLDRAWAGAWTIIYSRALPIHRGALQAHLGELSPPLVWKLCAAAALTPEDLRAGHQLAARAANALVEIVGPGGILLTPTTGSSANRVDLPYEGIDTMVWTAPASLAGLPAVSLPAGLTEAGMPIGVQLIGPRGADLTALATATRLEVAGIVGGLGSPPDAADDLVPSSLVPLEEPPRSSISDAEVDEVRRAASRMALPPLDPSLAEGAARALRFVRQVLY